jgi:hypothetical protein
VLIGERRRADEGDTDAYEKCRSAQRDRQTPQTPSREEIARLAEKFWAERGWPEGSPEQDWLRAEQELKTAS